MHGPAVVRVAEQGAVQGRRPKASRHFAEGQEPLMRVVAPAPNDLASLFGPETRTIWVCSPWITTDGVDLLRRALDGSEQKLLWSFELWLRLSEQDREVTDYGAIDEFFDELRTAAQDLAISIWTSPRLHAKVVWTERGALIGSANLTGPGFGGNVELAVRLEAAECLGSASIRDVLRQHLVEVPRDLWKAFVAGGEPPQADEPHEPVRNDAQLKAGW